MKLVLDGVDMLRMICIEPLVTQTKKSLLAPCNRGNRTAGYEMAEAGGNAQKTRSREKISTFEVINSQIPSKSPLSAFVSRDPTLGSGIVSSCMRPIISPARYPARQQGDDDGFSSPLSMWMVGIRSKGLERAATEHAHAICSIDFMFNLLDFCGTLLSSERHGLAVVERCPKASD